MKKISVLALLGMMLIFPRFAMTPVYGDCGSIAFAAPLIIDMEIASQVKNKSKDVKFNPLNVSVFEPKQRALISWNGDEEILLLSTDQKATEASAILEVIPLPSEPKVRLGKFETFEKAQQLMIQKRLWACAHGGAKAGIAEVPQEAGRITFNEKLGAHNIAVAESLNSEGFVKFVQDFLQKNYKTEDAPIKPDFVKIIELYLEQGFKWFAFDVIMLNETVKSREPIEYRFKSDCAFYPLQISALEQGKTEVDILIFTEKGITPPTGSIYKFMNFEPKFNVSKDEYEGLDDAWKGFFKNPQTIVTDQIKIEDKSSKLTTDVKVK